MPEAQDSAVQQFIRTRNAAHGQTQDIKPKAEKDESRPALDQLKLSTEYPNTQKYAVQPQALVEFPEREAGVSGFHQQSSAFPKREAGASGFHQQSPFYGTDADTEDLLTDPDVDQDQTLPATKPLVRPHVNRLGVDHHAIVASDGGTRATSGGPMPTTRPFQSAKREADQTQAPLMGQSRLTPFALERGDSYPPTTSGAPSRPDVNRYQDNDDETYNGMQQMRQAHAIIPGRPFNRRLGAESAKEQERQQSPNQKQYAPTQGHAAALHSGLRPKTNVNILTNTEAEVRANFAFGPATKVNGATVGNANSGQALGAQVKSATPRSNVADVRPTTYSVLPPRPEAPTQQKTVNPVLRDEHAGVTGQVQGQSERLRARRPEPPQTAEVPSDLGEEEMMDEGLDGVSEPGEQQDEPGVAEMEFDYPTHELIELDYESIQTAPFDTDPNALDDVAHLDDDKDEDLDQHLPTMAVRDDQAKAHFFASLPADRWEAAGDWFLARFGQCLDDLRALRRQKRGAAAAFEREVAARYEAVRHKRQLTQAAFDNMKESGGRVLLQGTPKRGK